MIHMVVELLVEFVEIVVLKSRAVLPRCISMGLVLVDTSPRVSGPSMTFLYPAAGIGTMLNTEMKRLVMSS